MSTRHPLLVVAAEQVDPESDALHAPDLGVIMAELLPAEELLFQLAAQGGGQVRLGGRFHRGLVERLGDDGELADRVRRAARG